MLEKISRINILKDFYGPLLTEKQQEVLSLHYEQDWSFAEIAEHLQVTRQAVYDLLRRAEAALEDYEQRLGLAERFLYTRRKLKEAYEYMDGEADPDRVNKALDIIREISESI
ncbi:YlxM family DNA-binding protein [Syntrophomonas palmitatica]|uniref:YlxM family DNA-binding protein n=1 Tax=Syntrophomonas palmitatica TaxID=402877 RepID=UPI0006D02E34|nr:YlxM family DNA-binding protein [Syntrophomonas palmitatica]